MFDFGKFQLEIDNYVAMDLLRHRQREWEAINPGTFAGIDIFLDLNKPIEKIKIEDRETAVADTQKIGD